MFCIFSDFTFVKGNCDEHCNLLVIAEMEVHKDVAVNTERLVVVGHSAAHRVCLASRERCILHFPPP